MRHLSKTVSHFRQKIRSFILILKILIIGIGIILALSTCSTTQKYRIISLSVPQDMEPLSFRQIKNYTTVIIPENLGISIRSINKTVPVFYNHDFLGNKIRLYSIKSGNTRFEFSFDSEEKFLKLPLAGPDSWDTLRSELTEKIIALEPDRVYQIHLHPEFDANRDTDRWNISLMDITLHASALQNNLSFLKSGSLDQTQINMQLPIFKFTPLYLAVAAGNYDFVYSLLEKGAESNLSVTKTINFSHLETLLDESPLQAACRLRYADIAELLLRFNAQPFENLKDLKNRSHWIFSHVNCLFYAASYGDLGLVSQLDPYIFNDKTKVYLKVNAALYMAIQNNNIEIVNYLTKNGILYNRPDDEFVEKNSVSLIDIINIATILDNIPAIERLMQKIEMSNYQRKLVYNSALKYAKNTYMETVLKIAYKQNIKSENVSPTKLALEAQQMQAQQLMQYSKSQEERSKQIIDTELRREIKQLIEKESIVARDRKQIKYLKGIYNLQSVTVKDWTKSGSLEIQFIDNKNERHKLVFSSYYKGQFSNSRKQKTNYGIMYEINLDGITHTTKRFTTINKTLPWTENGIQHWLDSLDFGIYKLKSRVARSFDGNSLLDISIYLKLTN